MLARAKLLHAQGYAVLLYDARGHGESSGSRVSIGWYETRDLLGALDYLRGRGFRQFGLIGEWQGRATIALAASDLRDVQWAVLESVYPTLRDAVDCRFRRYLLVSGRVGAALLLPFAEWRLGLQVDRIAPIERIGDLRCPVLIAHGDRDRNTLLGSARALFAHAREPKSLWIVPGAGHVDLYGYAKQDYENRVLAFIGSRPANVTTADPNSP